MAEQTTIYVDDDLRDRIEEELEYGDSFGQWMRTAAKLRLALKNGEEKEILDGLNAEA